MSLAGYLSLLPQVISGFLASAVEFVEALTVVLAVANVRGWRPALTGSLAGLTVLAATVMAFGPRLALLPFHLVQGVIGALLLLFGLRWLKKAILRAAGIIPLHDEDKIFAAEQTRLAQSTRSAGYDWLAFGAACKITLLEGFEVVFIILAVAGAGGDWRAAGFGAALALALVMLIGLALHRPLSKVPENQMKFLVGIMLSSFGLFWTAESLGWSWPGGDGALLVIIALTALLALTGVKLARLRSQ